MLRCGAKPTDSESILAATKDKMSFTRMNGYGDKNYGSKYSNTMDLTCVVRVVAILT